MGTRITLVITIVCGIAYPLVMTGVAQVAFNSRPTGAWSRDDKGNVVGSIADRSVLLQDDQGRSGNVTYQTVKDKSGNDLYFVVDHGTSRAGRCGHSRDHPRQRHHKTSLLQPTCNAANSLGSNLGPSNRS